MTEIREKMVTAEIGVDVITLLVLACFIAVQWGADCLCHLHAWAKEEVKNNF